MGFINKLSKMFVKAEDARYSKKASDDVLGVGVKEKSTGRIGEIISGDSGRFLISFDSPIAEGKGYGNRWVRRQGLIEEFEQLDRATGTWVPFSYSLISKKANVELKDENGVAAKLGDFVGDPSMGMFYGEIIKIELDEDGKPFGTCRDLTDNIGDTFQICNSDDETMSEYGFSFIIMNKQDHLDYLKENEPERYEKYLQTQSSKKADATDDLNAIWQETQSRIDAIQNHPVYQQVLADAFGGIMYNVANRGKYDDAEIIAMWNALDSSTQEASGGIMKGLFGFLMEKNASRKQAELGNYDLSVGDKVDANGQSGIIVGINTSMPSAWQYKVEMPDGSIQMFSPMDDIVKVAKTAMRDMDNNTVVVGDTVDVYGAGGFGVLFRGKIIEIEENSSICVDAETSGYSGKPFWAGPTTVKKVSGKTAKKSLSAYDEPTIWGIFENKGSDIDKQVNIVMNPAGDVTAIVKTTMYIDGVPNVVDNYTKTFTNLEGFREWFTNYQNLLVSKGFTKTFSKKADVLNGCDNCMKKGFSVPCKAGHELIIGDASGCPDFEPRIMFGTIGKQANLSVGDKVKVRQNGFAYFLDTNAPSGEGEIVTTNNQWGGGGLPIGVKYPDGVTHYFTEDDLEKTANTASKTAGGQYQYTILRADGTKEVLPPQSNEMGLKEMQAIVGGYIEIVPQYLMSSFGNDVTGFCNEEGKLMGLPINLHFKNSLTTDFVVGDCLLEKIGKTGKVANLDIDKLVRVASKTAVAIGDKIEAIDDLYFGEKLLVSKGTQGVVDMSLHTPSYNVPGSFSVTWDNGRVTGIKAKYENVDWVRVASKTAKESPFYVDQFVMMGDEKGIVTKDLGQDSDGYFWYYVRAGEEDLRGEYKVEERDIVAQEGDGGYGFEGGKISGKRKPRKPCKIGNRASGMVEIGDRFSLNNRNLLTGEVSARGMRVQDISGGNIICEYDDGGWKSFSSDEFWEAIEMGGIIRLSSKTAEDAWQNVNPTCPQCGNTNTYLEDYVLGAWICPECYKEFFEPFKMEAKIADVSITDAIQIGDRVNPGDWSFGGNVMSVKEDYYGEKWYTVSYDNGYSEELSEATLLSYLVPKISTKTSAFNSGDEVRVKDNCQTVSLRNRHGVVVTQDGIFVYVILDGEPSGLAFWDTELELYYPNRTSNRKTAVFTNDLKKGTRIKLQNGWEGTLMDNGRGNTRMAEVEGIATEIGSIYAWNIVAYQNEMGQWNYDIVYTDAQIKNRDLNRMMGFASKTAEVLYDANGEELKVGDKIVNDGYVGTITDIQPAGEGNGIGAPGDALIIGYHVDRVATSDEDMMGLFAAPGLVGRDSFVEDPSQCSKIGSKTATETFNIGDKVKLTTIFNPPYAGQEGVVVGINGLPPNSTYTVQINNKEVWDYILVDGDGCGTFDAFEITKVASKTAELYYAKDRDYTIFDECSYQDYGWYYWGIDNYTNQYVVVDGIMGKEMERTDDKAFAETVFNSCKAGLDDLIEYDRKNASKTASEGLCQSCDFAGVTDGLITECDNGVINERLKGQRKLGPDGGVLVVSPLTCPEFKPLGTSLSSKDATLQIPVCEQCQIEMDEEAPGYFVCPNCGASYGDGDINSFASRVAEESDKCSSCLSYEYREGGEGFEKNWCHKHANFVSLSIAKLCSDFMPASKVAYTDETLQDLKIGDKVDVDEMGIGTVVGFDKDNLDYPILVDFGDGEEPMPCWTGEVFKVGSKTAETKIPMSREEAKRILVTCNYDELREGVVDSMLVTWSEIDAGDYGFRGYDTLTKTVNSLSDEDMITVAQNIVFRRMDKVGKVKTAEEYNKELWDTIWEQTQRPDASPIEKKAFDWLNLDTTQFVSDGKAAWFETRDDCPDDIYDFLIAYIKQQGYDYPFSTDTASTKTSNDTRYLPDGRSTGYTDKHGRAILKGDMVRSTIVEEGYPDAVTEGKVVAWDEKTFYGGEHGNTIYLEKADGGWTAAFTDECEVL